LPSPPLGTRNASVLLRVGIDTGLGAYTPGFPGWSFEYIPIPITTGRKEWNNKRMEIRRGGMATTSAFSSSETKRFAISHSFDPEFEISYGDPTLQKHPSPLERRKPLVSYAGLEGWDFDCPQPFTSSLLRGSRAGRRLLSAVKIKELLGTTPRPTFSVFFEDQKDRSF